MDKEYFFKTDQLVIWRPSGILVSEKIYEFIRFLNKSSEGRDPHFDRFIDLSHSSGISVNYKDLQPVADQRKLYYSTILKQKVKMAVLANNPISFGMARMYQTISDDAHIEINIYDNFEDCSKFLKVDISLIHD